MDDMKSKMQTERIVLNIPVELTLEEFGKLCKIGPESSAYEALEEALPLVKQYGAPKAVLRWANVDRVEGDETTI
jgi:hypothetical protein